MSTRLAARQGRNSDPHNERTDAGTQHARCRATQQVVSTGQGREEGEAATHRSTEHAKGQREGKRRSSCLHAQVHRWHCALPTSSRTHRAATRRANGNRVNIGRQQRQQRPHTTDTQGAAAMKVGGAHARRTRMRDSAQCSWEEGRTAATKPVEQDAGRRRRRERVVRLSCGADSEACGTRARRDGLRD
ncbi:hypothetical protein ERJ75_000308100 [Trypanosoma vivax]|nr:hypothetical protein ERJ75_000308100 [Trypanosoma vivax]